MSLQESPTPIDLPVSGSEIEQNVPRVVKMLMGFRGVTARETSAALHLHPNRFSERMTGKRPFSIAETIELANFLDVEASLFLRPPAELAERVQNWKILNGEGPKLTLVPDLPAVQLPLFGGIGSSQNPHPRNLQLVGR